MVTICRSTACFNTHKLHFTRTVCLCVSYDPHIEQRFLPKTTLTGCSTSIWYPCFIFAVPRRRGYLPASIAKAQVQYSLCAIFIGQNVTARGFPPTGLGSAASSITHSALPQWYIYQKDKRAKPGDILRVSSIKTQLIYCKL
jgi:hypothetical protein